MLLWNLIFFDDSKLTKKVKPKKWNNHRKARARSAIKKQRDRAGLFGEELMKHTTVEDRLNDLDKVFNKRILHYRRADAIDLLKCRKAFKALPVNIKNDLIEYWDRSSVPKEPFRFLSIINSYKRDPLFFERRKGNATSFIKWIIGENKILKVIEISQEEYYTQANNIDKNK